ncbi:MAG: PAS domain S-box protein [Planctomycetes bacterium]|nr:PAS domain S-box protein [Planctomycetota bacterium]
MNGSARDIASTDESASPPAPEEHAAQDRVSILIVDDYPEALLALQAMLEGVSRHLVLAHSGEEALRCVLREDFAVILLDVLMPGMDGFETATLLRRRERSRSTPIIFLTAANRAEEDVRRAYHLGAVDYIFKPVVPDILVSKVMVFVELARKTALVREQVARLQRSELDRSRLSAIVESCDDSIVGCDLEGIVQSWNAGAERIFGYPAHAMLDRPIAVLVPPDRPDDIAERIRALRRAEPRRTLEATRLTADGRRIEVSSSMSPIRDGSGALIGVSLVARDITEQKRAATALHDAMEAAERANRELEAFSYSVSHDLRAPLRAIAGFGQTLVENYGPRLDEKGVHYLERMCAASRRMGELIDDLLELSRLGRACLRSEVVDLSRIAAAIADELRRAAPDRTVEFAIAPDLTVRGDPGLLTCLLENLLRNAWKFTGRHPRARIEFGVERAAEGPVFFVRDDGAGFDMAYAEKLFAPFQRLHGEDEFEGTGIGLAIVQRIVHRHGGRVWAQGAPEQGAAFHFTLG